eukprot:4843595-Amphidinium_carterae.1
MLQTLPEDTLYASGLSTSWLASTLSRVACRTWAGILIKLICWVRENPLLSTVAHERLRAHA